MSGLMPGCLIASVLGVVRVEQHARSQSFIKRKQSRNAAAEPAHVNAETYFHFKQSHNIGDRPDTKTQTFAKLGGVLFGLQPHVAWKKVTFRRIVAAALHPQKILEFDFS